MTDSRVDVLRDFWRDDIKFKRKSRKGEELLSRRDLGNDFVKDTKEYIVQCANKLKTRLQIELGGLNLLQNCLLESEDHISSFLKVHGALYGLVRELTGIDSAKQNAAAGCLCNLSLLGGRSANAIAKFAGAYLIMLLDSMNADLVVICAWTIGNLIAGSEGAYRLLWVPGTLLKLKHALNRMDSDDIPNAAAYALTHALMRTDSQLEVRDVTDIATAIVKHGKPTHELNQLLFLISCTLQYTQAMPKLSVISYLLKGLRLVLASDRTKPIWPMQIQAVLRSLANTCCEKKSCDDFVSCIFVDDANFEMFIDAIRVANDGIKQDFLWLMGNVYNFASVGAAKTELFQRFNILLSELLM